MSRESVRVIIENSPELQQKTLSDEDEIRHLAKLQTFQYHRERKAAAEKLGITLGALDTEVKRARQEGAETPGQGRPLELDEVKPWPVMAPRC